MEAKRRKLNALIETLTEDSVDFLVDEIEWDEKSRSAEQRELEKQRGVRFIPVDQSCRSVLPGWVKYTDTIAVTIDPEERTLLEKQLIAGLIKEPFRKHIDEDDDIECQEDPKSGEGLFDVYFRPFDLDTEGWFMYEDCSITRTYIERAEGFLVVGDKVYVFGYFENERPSVHDLYAAYCEQKPVPDEHDYTELKYGDGSTCSVTVMSHEEFKKDLGRLLPIRL